MENLDCDYSLHFGSDIAEEIMSAVDLKMSVSLLAICDGILLETKLAAVSFFFVELELF